MKVPLFPIPLKPPSIKVQASPMTPATKATATPILARPPFTFPALSVLVASAAALETLDKDSETLGGSTVGELLLNRGGLWWWYRSCCSNWYGVLVAGCRRACVGCHCEGARAEKVVDI
jgi:hypothetical protein